MCELDMERRYVSMGANTCADELTVREFLQKVLPAHTHVACAIPHFSHLPLQPALCSPFPVQPTPTRLPHILINLNNSREPWALNQLLIPLR